MATDPFTTGLGALTVAGGLVGFLKSSSVPSLVAGTASGSALLWAGLNSPGASGYGGHGYARHVGMGVSLLLTIMMGSRFLRSKKVMPAGLVAALSLANLLRYCFLLL